MNTLLSTIRKCNINVISKVLKNNLSSEAPSSSSAYGWKWDLKVTWDRPKNVPHFHPSKSGDCGITHNVKETDPAKNFGQCEEYKTADETVKKLLSLEYYPKQEIKRKIVEAATDAVKRHKYDKGSLEFRVAKMTARIVWLQNFVDGKGKLQKTKQYLGELIDKRQRYLRKLRMWDYKRYEFLIERLNINFRTTPEPVHQVTRKDSLRKLTQKYHDKVVNDKINAYKAELESQQKDFYKEKAEKLAFIRSEELSLGLEPTVTEQEIAAAREKAEQLALLK
ncbi:28S ribosomal protein S15, mitochondrial [Chelonus insularis]|uniref:28S ribosomal protein S15, mitochondrial n=1 Tax=Chelonus insularis TaxID=460826 RepID=UPI00158E8B8F|nr:28S ribosomal protein S15, mitochondrial [Chelonus insularis]XP_034939042.1 28S ribosomal protein S15, mitochondrial [Chelonus insularis]